jgi:hypothetical protein
LALKAEIKKHFLQGLKPIHAERFTPGLKPQPPKESDIFRNLQILASTKPEEFTRCLPVAEIGYSGWRAIHSPYSRAAATALHRLPEHEVRG